jgi:hypothetical protein
VSIGTPWFGLHVRAAEYRSGDAPAKVLEFYRAQLEQYGAVIEFALVSVPTAAGQ